jgi:hypothetical protein
MKEFRTGSSRVLITTDLLARGIDVQQVSLGKHCKRIASRCITCVFVLLFSFIRIPFSATICSRLHVY